MSFHQCLTTSLRLMTIDHLKICWFHGIFWDEYSMKYPTKNVIMADGTPKNLR